MNDYIINKIPYSNNPYFITSINREIKSIWELCYFIKNNIPLDDKTLLNDKLIKWIDEELKQKHLAGRLRAIIGKENYCKDFVLTIFDYLDCLSQGGFLELRNSFDSYNNLDDNSKKLEIGLSYMKNNLFKKSIKYFKSVFYNVNELEPEIKGRLYYYLGCSYNNIFMFKEAFNNFEKAYEINPSTKISSYLIITAKLVFNEQQYRDYVYSNSFHDESIKYAENLMIIAETEANKIEIENSEAMMEEIKKNYLRNQ